jgi:hypothetical protein
MQLPVDTNQLQARFNELRRSEYFPAVLGAVAGGVTGGLMSVLVGRGKRVQVVRETVAAPEKSGLILGYSLGELVQLATVVMGLVRTVRAMRQEDNARM